MDEYADLTGEERKAMLQALRDEMGWHTSEYMRCWNLARQLEQSLGQGDAPKQRSMFFGQRYEAVVDPEDGDLVIWREAFADDEDC